MFFCRLAKTTCTRKCRRNPTWYTDNRHTLFFFSNFFFTLKVKFYSNFFLCQLYHHFLISSFTSFFYFNFISFFLFKLYLRFYLYLYFYFYFYFYFCFHFYFHFHFIVSLSLGSMPRCLDVICRNEVVEQAKAGMYLHTCGLSFLKKQYQSYFRY